MSPLTSITDWYYGVDAGTERAKEERRAATLERILNNKSQRPAGSRVRRAAELTARVDRVVLKVGARSEIVNELADWDAGTECESRETGGYLIGRLQETTLVVTAAFGPGPGAVRGYGRLNLDTGYTQSVMGACLADEAILGDWHSHPGSARPSEVDMRNWAGAARRFGKRGAVESLGAFNLCLVATPACGSWAYPRFFGFVSRGDESAVEPIALDEEREVEEGGRRRLMLVRSTSSETGRERWRL